VAEHRYYVMPPGGEGAFGYDSAEAAEAVARDYGPGAHIVDTGAMPYYPMVHRIDEAGEPVYLEYGAWDTRVGLDRNLVEAVKKGYPPIVQAFLAKGANVNAVDDDGGTPLIWAVARGQPEIVRLLLSRGADVLAADTGGMTALKLAERKKLPEIAEILRAAGAAG
jgi:hypothetical protein